MRFARRARFETVHASINSWARSQADVAGVVLVGSWARNEARPDSDVDVVVLSSSSGYVDGADWIQEALPAGAVLIRTATWGPLTERRALCRDGLEVEFGFVDPSWAGTDPIDVGTARVMEDGHQIWYDPSGLLAELASVVAARSAD